MSIKNNKSRQVSQRIKIDLYEWLKAYADKNRISLGAALNMAIAKFRELEK